VRNVQATVDGTFHGAKKTSARGRSGQADVQEAAKRARLTIDRLHVVVFAVHLLDTFVDAVKTELFQMLNKIGTI